MASTSSIPLQVRCTLLGTREAMIPTRIITLPISHTVYSMVVGNETELVKVTARFAEEMFDLSGNPSREDQAQKVWKIADSEGCARSLSVGDWVSLDLPCGKTMIAICCSVGWFIAEKREALTGQFDGYEMWELLDEIAETPSRDCWFFVSGITPNA